MKLDKNTNGLYTVRSYKETFGLFLGTLLGSVFGIMGSTGAVLRIVEGSSVTTQKFLNRKTFSMAKRKRLKAMHYDMSKTYPNPIIDQTVNDSNIVM